MFTHAKYYPAAKRKMRFPLFTFGTFLTKDSDLTEITVQRKHPNNDWENAITDWLERKGQILYSV